MDAIEYTVTVASQTASNGNTKEAYDQFLSALGKLVVRLKTTAEMHDNGIANNADEALFRMIPLCRTCINKIEDILQPSIMPSSRGNQKVQTPRPLSKGPDRLTSSFLSGIETSHSTVINEASLFSAVFDGFPGKFELPRNDVDQSKADSFVSFEGSISLQESARGSIGDTNVEISNEESIRDGDASATYSLLPPETPMAKSPSFGLQIDQKSMNSDVHASVETIKTAKSSSPEVPPSPLNTMYMNLSQKLITSLSNSSVVSPNNPQIEGKDEEANLIRSRIAKILHQIQVASTNNSINVNLFCFRPIALAFQLCVTEHSLLRGIHSSDILRHKPPQSPAPSLQALSDFFNYFTRLIECTILQHQQIGDRVKAILKWIKVASFLKKFNNFQSLKGVTSALQTPPINRLKKTWSILKRKNGIEIGELEELTKLVSEQNNYSSYRTYIKENETRPMVPFVGVLIHDVTYLLAVAKKEGNADLSSDKRIQDIQKFIRHCIMGPRYSYEMLIDMDESTSNTSQSGQIGKKTAVNLKRKIKGGGLTEIGIEQLGSIFKDASDEDIGIFLAHWLLTRKWIPEKEIDELSLLREPKATATSAKSFNSTSQNAKLVDSQEEKECSQTRSSKSDDADIESQTKSMPCQSEVNTSLKITREISPTPASPSLLRSRTNATSNSFISVLENAFSSKQNKSGTSSPANTTASSPGKKQNSPAKLAADNLLRGRPLDRFLNRRQKSLTNLGLEELGSGSKSVSMDSVNTRNPAEATELNSLPEKAGSYDSVTGSRAPSNANGLLDESGSVYVVGYAGVESEELKKKLEVLVTAQLPSESRLTEHVRASSSTVSSSPIKEKENPPPVPARHSFFSFFTHSEPDAKVTSEETTSFRTSKTERRISAKASHAFTESLRGNTTIENDEGLNEVPASKEASKQKPRRRASSASLADVLRFSDLMRNSPDAEKANADNQVETAKIFAETEEDVDITSSIVEPLDRNSTVTPKSKLSSKKKPTDSEPCDKSEGLPAHITSTATNSSSLLSGWGKRSTTKPPPNDIIVVEKLTKAGVPPLELPKKSLPALPKAMQSKSPLTINSPPIPPKPLTLSRNKLDNSSSNNSVNSQ